MKKYRPNRGNTQKQDNTGVRDASDQQQPAFSPLVRIEAAGDGNLQQQKQPQQKKQEMPSSEKIKGKWKQDIK